MPEVPVTRSGEVLLPDPKRRISKPYFPTDPGSIAGSTTRVERLIDRVLGLSPSQAAETLAGVRDGFGGRIANLDEVLARGFSAVSPFIPVTAQISQEVQDLLGAYFMHEYTIEGSALTNPSIVASPYQNGITSDHLSVIVSLRAVGEGHISSIEFRTGVVDADGNISIDPPEAPVSGTRGSPLFHKPVFVSQLRDRGADPWMVAEALDPLDDRFTMESLEGALLILEQRVGHTPSVDQVIAGIHWLVSSNYLVEFTPDTEISQRVLSPSGPSESGGMEDARFVRHVEPDGSVRYYATYTAYDGFNILPQLIETTDFAGFHVATLGGRFSVNKGIAMFPRQVGGRYAALSRYDGESNQVMFSEDVRFWDEAHQIQTPTQPWELLQIGNAGSPLETEAGWLVVTHGVGPMRAYALGAILLDLEDPTRVIGRMPQPLLVPDETEREGYVPNVVYSCGSLIHGDRLFIAYGASDTSTRFATVMVDDVLRALTDSSD